MFKKFLVTIGLLTGLTARTYGADVVVTFCDNTRGTVIAEDRTGNLYAFDGYKMYPGQEVTLALDNNGTPKNREDDLIIDVKVKEGSICQ